MTAQNLDPGTLMFATAVLGFLTAGFSFTTVKALSGTGKGVEEWGWAMMTLGGAFLLWFLTPATSALFFLGNVLVVLTGLFLLRAFFQLTGKPFARIGNIAIVLLGTSGIGATYYFDAPRSIAVVTIAASHLVMVIGSSVRLLRSPKYLQGTYRGVIVAVLLLLGSATSVRIWIVLFGQGAAMVSPVASSAAQVLTTSTAALLIVAGSFGYFGILGEQQRQQLLENSRRDALTELYTRGAFFEMAEKLLAGRNSPYSTLMIDLDNFKNINDTYGHVAGDTVIRHAASLILQSIREGDIAGRYGGEELCVLLPRCGRVAARRIAERIVCGAAEQVIHLSKGQRIAYTVSLGLATYDPSEFSASKPPKLEDLLSSADSALYRAKDRGKNQVQAI